MASILFKGNPVDTAGDFPQVGQDASDFQLIAGDLSEVNLDSFAGKTIVFNIFPSVDTAVCALQMKAFSQKLSGMDNVVMLSASIDLPFALSRFCAAEGIENAVSTSDFRHHSLANWGVKMENGPLAGLYARAVLVIDAQKRIIHSELVADVVNEPDYDAVLALL